MDIAAREAVKGSAEAAGPHVIIAREQDLLQAVPDPVAPDKNYLMGRIALTRDEMALALGIGLDALDAAVRRGDLPSVLIGGRRLFPIKAIENHLSALAYASSGALDGWERALVQATAARLKVAQRRAKERSRTLQRRLARQGGIATEQDAIEARALLAELDSQQALALAQREKLVTQIEKVERDANRGV